MVEYRVEATNRAEFLGAVDELGHARRRDGAYAWGVYEDVADVGRFVETFTIDSWLELMHQRERVTNADEMLVNRVRHLLAEPPRVTHLRVLGAPSPDLEKPGRSSDRALLNRPIVQDASGFAFGNAILPPSTIAGGAEFNALAQCWPALNMAMQSSILEATLPMTRSCVAGNQPLRSA